MDALKRSVYPLAFTISFFYLMFLYSVIPFVSIPNTAISIWAIGFARSIANSPWFSTHALNLGYPHPAGIAFGLPAVLPTSWLIKIGLAGVDAYSIIFSVFLLIGLLGSKGFASHIGLRSPYNWLSAMVWMTLPILWLHTNFSYLSIGFMLIPTYTYILELARKKFSEGLPPAIIASFIAISTVTFTLFMDGYSFVFTFAIQVILGAFNMRAPSQKDRKASLIFEIILMVGLIVATTLYTLYFGVSINFHATIDFIRGYGIDLAFLALPTQGIYWFFDALHLSVHRDPSMFFGDDSVWKYTYITPFLLLSFITLIRSKVGINKVIPFLMIFIIGFYMAIGPSIKINSLKPVDYDPSVQLDQGNAMEEEYALFPTGSALIYKLIPQFRVLRATYRWLVLAGLGAWVVLTMSAAALNEKRLRIWSIACVVLILITAPRIKQHTLSTMANRNYVASFERLLFPTFNEHIQPGEIAIFYPAYNDFLINEIASAGNFITYNIGGDKNFSAAAINWPSDLFTLMDTLESDPVDNLNEIFDQVQVDVFVVPFFDLFRSSFIENPFYENLTPEKNPQTMELFKDVLNDPNFETTVTDLAIFIRRAE